MSSENINHSINPNRKKEAPNYFARRLALLAMASLMVFGGVEAVEHISTGIEVSVDKLNNPYEASIESHAYVVQDGDRLWDLVKTQISYPGSDINSFRMDEIIKIIRSDPRNKESISDKNGLIARTIVYFPESITKR